LEEAVRVSKFEGSTIIFDSSTDGLTARFWFFDSVWNDEKFFIGCDRSRGVTKSGERVAVDVAI
jgi:hypothetical protein